MVWINIQRTGDWFQKRLVFTKLLPSLNTSSPFCHKYKPTKKGIKITREQDE